MQLEGPFGKGFECQKSKSCEGGRNLADFRVVAKIDLCLFKYVVHLFPKRYKS